MASLVIGSTNYLSSNYLCFIICLNFLRCLHVFESPFPLLYFCKFYYNFSEISILLNVYYCCYFSLFKGNYILVILFYSQPPFKEKMVYKRLLFILILLFIQDKEKFLFIQDKEKFLFILFSTIKRNFSLFLDPQLQIYWDFFHFFYQSLNLLFPLSNFYTFIANYYFPLVLDPPQGC